MIRVLIVEPMNLLRGALAATLALEQDLDVIGAVGTWDEAAARARVVPPDVTVVNIDLLTGEGRSTVARLRAELPGCATLLLAGTDAPGQVSRALDEHVHGVIDIQATPSEMVVSIQRLARGERVIDARLAVAVLAASRSPLSPRELRVLSVVASGAPSREVAAKLHLTAGTVRNYVSTILRKTGARNRLEAVRLAEESGWLS